MRVPGTVLAEVDYRDAVVAELSARNRYLPPPLADRALLDHVDDLADRLKTRMRRDFEPQRQDSVLARKVGRGSRPLPYLTLEDRLVYRSLVNTLTDRLPVVPGRGDYDAFVKSPLGVPECKFVLKADVSAYYQYIDHERLIDEVVAQTGDDLAVTAAVELLQGASGRQFGLPQMNVSSDVLADLYVDPIRRDLLRRGHAVFRFADDFRVACEDYSEALESLELIERAALELGLVLNEAKTGTPRKETYEASLEEVARAEQQLFAELAIEGVTVEAFFVGAADAYTDDDETTEELIDVVVSPVPELETRRLPGTAHDEADPPEEPEAAKTPTEDELEIASRVVTFWSSKLTKAKYRWSPAVWSTLLRKSLATLEVGRNPRAVSSAIELLVREPHLTPQVCNYLIAVGQNEPQQVHHVLNELCGRDTNIVSIWQSLWVAYLAGSVSSAVGRPPRHVEWLRQQVDSPHDAVSAQAALALARRGMLTVDLGSRAYERASEPHRPTAALALAAAQGRARGDVVRADQVEGWLADWAGEQSWGRPRRVVRRSRLQPPKRSS